MENGEKGGATIGIAWLTHDIPAGPALVSPPEKATVSAGDLSMSWEPVTKSIKGTPVNIIAYQLIVEKDEEPHKHKKVTQNPD